ncbi:MAG: efflux transporter periplasmic adaptor subunit [Rhizobacter sp.]|nr:efflux transporter periplasmic adaptor subunit [Rhizobacter sp.]
MRPHLPERRPPARAWIGAIVVAVAVALVMAITWFVTAWTHAAEPSPESQTHLQHDAEAVLVPPASALRKTLVMAASRLQAVQVPLALPASVEADPARLVKITPPVAGRIASLSKGLGDEVHASEVLFRIDSPDMAQATSDAHKARAAMLLASQALTRQRDLGTDQIAAQRDVEQAQNDFDQAASDFARAQARLSQLGVAGSASARQPGGAVPASGDARTVTVRSPISGRVVDIAGANGAFWNDTTAPLLTVADLSTVFVTAAVDERDLGSVFVGQDVRVTLGAYPDAPLVGKVRRVGEMLDADTRRVKVRVRFDNRDGRLKPGMFAQAVVLGKPHPALLVPTTSLVQSGFDTRVYVEVQPWRFEPRVVHVGATIGDQVEIVSGIEPGDKVVTTDAVLLDE